MISAAGIHREVAQMRRAVTLMIVVSFCLLGAASCGKPKQVAGPENTPAMRKTEEHSGEIVWRVKTDRKLVALTLDDGPDPKYTPGVLKMAKEKGVKLTFFLLGRNIQLYPQLAKREVAEGHVIGNHTWDHHKLAYLDEGKNFWELGKCEDEIQKICGERTHLFRPPYGMWDGDTFTAAVDDGFRIILWTVSIEHHTVKTPEEMAKRIIDMAQPGMIILAHDGEPLHKLSRAKAVATLPLIIDGLKAKGYEFVTIPELLKAGGITD
jgi:peptidoglycan/xylan/chitin deacetylase (PgdA/CDA1 family)